MAEMTLAQATAIMESTLSDWSNEMRDDDEYMVALRTLLAAAKAREGEVKGWAVKMTAPAALLVYTTKEEATSWNYSWEQVVPVAIRETEEPAGE